MSAAQRNIAISDAADDVRIGVEAPILVSAHDRLRRAGFAGRVAEVLSQRSPECGRVFAIRGGWGFGKSSLKNLVAEKLTALPRGAQWLDFNPWQWGDGDSITRALFEQIAGKLGGKYSAAEAARAEEFRRYGRILTGISGPLKTSSGSTQILSTLLTSASVIALAEAFRLSLPEVSTVAGVLAFLAILASSTGKLISHLGRDRSTDSLGKVRKSLEVSLASLDEPLVIFVDDIDRLEPDQIRTLLRQVKANANLPNIVFVLLYQSSIVESALNPVSNGHGRAFLEKIIQTNFDLPEVPKTTVHRIFGEELSKLATTYARNENGFENQRWGNLLVGTIQPRIENLRDVRRLISSIAVHLPLHGSGEAFEVNLIDFLVLETIRVFEPELYRRLSREPDLLLRFSRKAGDDRRKAVKASAQELIAVVTTDRHQWAQDTVSQLFPQLEWAYGGTQYEDSVEHAWMTARRVCSTRYFPRYFELQLGEDEISQSVFLRFLAATSEKEALEGVVEEIEAASQLPSLVSRLNECVEQLPTENAATLLPIMFLLGQKVVGTRSHDPFSSSWVSAWQATNRYLRLIPSYLRGPLAIDALKQSESLSMGTILISLSEPKTSADGENGIARELAPDPESLEEMKAQWLQLVRRRAVESGRLLADEDLLSILYRWRDYSGSIREPQSWISAVIKSDDGFAMVVSKLMTRGTSFTAGDRVEMAHNTFDKQTIEDLIGFEIVVNRYQNFDFNLNQIDPEAMRILGRHLDHWLSKKNKYSTLAM